jgi:hypothetical protein
MHFARKLDGCRATNVRYAIILLRVYIIIIIIKRVFNATYVIHGSEESQSRADNDVKFPSKMHQGL